MSAALFVTAAEQIREDCPIPQHGRQLDFIDYPTAWALQRAGVQHVDSACSAERTASAMLCDCGALYPAWRRWRALLLVAELLESARCSLGCGPDGKVAPYCSRCEDSTDDHVCPARETCRHTADFRRAIAIATAYLPDSPASAGPAGPTA